MTTTTVGRSGEVTLPGDVRDRYGMSPETQVRLVETQAGLLLVPLSGEPMSEALAQELAQWHELGRQSWELFPYEEEAPSPLAMSIGSRCPAAGVMPKPDAGRRL